MEKVKLSYSIKADSPLGRKFMLAHVNPFTPEADEVYTLKEIRCDKSGDVWVKISYGYTTTTMTAAELMHNYVEIVEE